MVNVKKIIVTGSSSGIGNSITKELIKKKIKVIGISRNNNKSLIKSKYFQSEKIDLSELKNILRANDIVYIKGSRGMKMENIIKGIA